MESLRSLHVLGTPTSVALSGTLLLAAFLLYRWLLPKPIPGIPYNPEATKSIFGEIPSLMAHLKTHKTVSDWMGGHNARHSSPIVQIMPYLFGRPVVVLHDYREAQDVLVRRSKEFDKPDLLTDVFFGINPEHHTMKTGDEWRYQRKLMQDLMSPSFLNGIAAPQLHANFTDLIRLWTEKMRLSEGRSFSAAHDIYGTALEAIWAAVFGIEGAKTITRNNISLLSPKKSITLPSTSDDAAEFDSAPAPPEFDAVLRITDGIEDSIKSPFPRVVGWLYRVWSLRSWHRLKDEMCHREVTKAEKRMAQINGNMEKMSNAVDHMLRREKMAAERQNRKPGYHSEVMVAELFGLLVAGHDTTSTTLLWAMKFLASHQDIQRSLRAELHKRYSTAHEQNRSPSGLEIVTTLSHLIDAFIEETLRCANTGALVSRSAVTDTVILGHAIPKGTRIIIPGHSMGTFSAPYKISDNLRSQTYHNADTARVGNWDVEDITKFKPERWLVHDKATGAKVFDPSAGPHLAFGGGPRGCFGKKMAYLELRIALVLVLWNFELQPTEEKYSSWEAQEILTHSPVQCYVKLAKASTVGQP